MIGNEFVCARPECDVVARKTTHNQKYCSGECCRIVTNKNIMDRYYEKQAIRKGQKRSCKGCGSALSRYNDSSTCGACDVKERDSRRADVSHLSAIIG